MKPSPASNPPSRPRFIIPRWTHKLMRLGTRQDLIDREQAIEPRRAQPLLLVDQFAPDHRDLRHRPAPREQPELQEAREQAAASAFSRMVWSMRGCHAADGP